MAPSAAETQALVLRQGVKLMAVRTGVGLALSLLVGNVLSGRSFHVNGADPLVISASVLLLGVAALAAIFRRAGRRGST
jgi:ABC-type nickel/cobalt efflux system permease component RcnA